jgi:hypothetical protein
MAKVRVLNIKSFLNAIYLLSLKFADYGIIAI